MADQAPGQKAVASRIPALDTLRGLTIVSMVLFHATYDLAYLYGIEVDWFLFGPVQDIWRNSISWTFLFLAGWMTSFSRDNLRRGGRYALAALVVFAVTAIARVDTPISYGIIFCMAAMTLIWGCVERFAPNALDRAPRLAWVLPLALFFLTRGVPHHRYAIEHLAWLGFPSPGFTSGDYYPLIPFGFMYLSGALMARAVRGEGDWDPERFPAWMRRDLCPALTFLGRHSLPIYLLHQPIVLLAIDLVLG